MDIFSMTYNFDIKTIAPGKDEPKFPPFVHIYIKTCTRGDYFGSGHPTTFISPQMMTDNEIDYEVNRLITELETIRKKAKQELRKAKEKTRKK
ncbi:hypothetical protein ACUUL3_16770 [Thiovibrio sp. JS02]